MVPGKYNITLFRGSTYSTGITARTEVGVSETFDQYTTMRMQVRPPWAATLGTERPEPLLELTKAGGGLVVTGDGLGFSINLTAAETEALTFTDGIYDIELVIEEEGEPDIVNKILYGKVHVMGEVTV